MRKHILFVDDDWVPADYYFYALKLRNLDVVFYPNTDEAIASMENSEPALAIFDVMMPPGALTQYDTKEGLLTGFYLYRKLREQYPNLPVLILTNSLSAPELFRLEKKVRVLSKSLYPPLELAAAAEEMMTREEEQGSNG